MTIPHKQHFYLETQTEVCKPRWPNASLPLLSSKTYLLGFLFIFVTLLLPLGCMIHTFLAERCSKLDKVLQVRLFQSRAELLHDLLHTPTCSLQHKILRIYA